MGSLCPCKLQSALMRCRELGHLPLCYVILSNAYMYIHLTFQCIKFYWNTDLVIVAELFWNFAFELVYPLKFQLLYIIWFL